MAGFAGPNVVTDKLTSHLDAANTQSYPGSGTAWNDISGNGNNGSNGTGAGACSFESSEPKCFVFDASNNNGRIMGPPLYNSINEGSVEVWFQHNQSTSTAANPGMLYFEGDDNGYGSNKEMHLAVTSNSNLQFYLESGNTNDISISTTVAIPANTWTCATVTFSGLTGQINGGGANGKNAKIYVNGSFSIGQYKAGDYGGGSNPTNSFIGRSRTQVNGKYRGLVGKIAVVKCYSKFLSESEVFQNYLALKGRYM